MHTYEKSAPSASKLAQNGFMFLCDLAGFLLMLKSDLRGDHFVFRVTTSKCSSWNLGTQLKYFSGALWTETRKFSSSQSLSLQEAELLVQKDLRRSNFGRI